MGKLEEIAALVRSINADEFQTQLTNGNSLEYIHRELLFLAEKIDSKKKRTDAIIDHISNCYSGDFFSYLPISDKQDELDVFCMGFNTYIEELQAVMVSKNLLEASNKKLQEEKERSEHLARARDEFLSSMSHEIRTPLNGILGFTDLLLKNPSLDAESKKQLDYIMMSGDILLVIINDILDLAKIESGQITLYEKPFELAKLIQLVYDAFSTKIQEKNLSFETSIDKKIPSIVKGDSVRVAQILFNLISNSVKFTPLKGRITLNIDLEKEDAEFYYVNLTVEDTGIGIAPNKIDTIFDPFIQVSDDTARKYGGTGLGLTIIKKIITMMNGGIEVKSELNVGTKFMVHLPFAKVSNYPSAAELVIEKNEPELLFAKDKKIKVLLAEDNKINQLLAKKVLANYNFDCVIVENGSLAVEAVINENFDIVLMDIMMPVMDGYEATSIIRNLTDETKRNIPIIALTAVVTGLIVEDCAKAGMNSYLSKPFESEALYKAITKLV